MKCLGMGLAKVFWGGILSITKLNERENQNLRVVLLSFWCFLAAAVSQNLFAMPGTMPAMLVWRVLGYSLSSFLGAFHKYSQTFKTWDAS